MKSDNELNTNSSSRFEERRGERGAALVTMLLVSILLLGAGGALITTTMLSANNSVGSTAEMQAYYVAEAGMQSALNVLRGNTQPLVKATDRMSFRTAVVPDISNGPGNSGSLRLAGWLPYNDRFNPASLVPVSIGTITGGYRVTVEDVAPNSHIVEFQTSGVINGSDVATPSAITFGWGSAKQVTIRYAGQASTTLTPNPNSYPLTLGSTLGSFVIERPNTSTANDVTIPKTAFEVTITQTRPWSATTTLEGTFEGEVDRNASTVKVTFNKASVKADGTTYALNLASGTRILDLSYTTSPTSTTIPIRITSPDPKRLLVKSYGFGPQGAEKRLELMVTRANFDFEIPASVTLRGADDCSSLLLDTGSSSAERYSGVDYSGMEAPRPTFAVSPCDEDEAAQGIKKHDAVADPEIGLLVDDASDSGEVEQPWFLDTADNARAYLNNLQMQAQSLDRYFNASGSAMKINDSLNAPMFTFVDGDCTLESGSGFLVVTGTLTLRGGSSFKGAILVFGKGVVIRDGGGNGEILGAITVASFGRTSGDFSTPTFQSGGGGSSNVQYDSSALYRGMTSGAIVSGIREF